MSADRAGAPWGAEIDRAATILYAAGATAVWLFGSRARSSRVDRLTDYDLAVEGIGPDAQAIRLAARALPAKSDIVCLETASPVLRWGVMRDRIHVSARSVQALADPHEPVRQTTLYDVRLHEVAARIRATVPSSVIDFGCGDGALLETLAADPGIVRLTGIDFDATTLKRARRRLGSRAGVTLCEDLLTRRSALYLDHDVAIAVEVIEHLEVPQLQAFVGVLFDHVRPRCVLLTTPNAEYNHTWSAKRHGGRRHHDHRFEWSRREFGAWADRVAHAYRYDVKLVSIGSVHPDFGPPTQLAQFYRR